MYRVPAAPLPARARRHETAFLIVVSTLAPLRRAERLLAVTRERRMLAHLWAHRGLIKRLRSWCGYATTAVSKDIVKHIWSRAGVPRQVLEILGIM